MSDLFKEILNGHFENIDEFSKFLSLIILFIASVFLVWLRKIILDSIKKLFVFLSEKLFKNLKNRKFEKLAKSFFGFKKDI